MIKIDSAILNSEAFTSLLEKVESLTFKKGELILKGGEICKYLFIVENGLLRNFYYDGKGNDITHWFAKEKMIITAPESFFNQEKSFFNIEAIEDTRVIAIRFEVLEASGCTGYTYSMDFVDEGSKDDLIFDFSDLKVFIDPSSYKYLKGTKVDFTIEGVNQGVKFLNPNVKAVCGCGESFEVDI